MFQSRNRGTCRFKERQKRLGIYRGDSFNLVIEVLVVSSSRWRSLMRSLPSSFQSRNRGTCRFKYTRIVASRA